MIKIITKTVIFCPFEKKEINIQNCFTCINFSGSYGTIGGDHFISCLRVKEIGYFDRALREIVRSGRWDELPAPCNQSNTKPCAYCEKWGSDRCLALKRENREKLRLGAKYD